jgi:hypothetical protein
MAASATAASVLAACGEASSLPTPAASGYRLTNDSRSVVTVTDCTGNQPSGCVVRSKIELSPGESATFPLSPAGVGSTPDSLAIHRGDHGQTCMTIPPSSPGGLYTATVTQARAKECTVQDARSR